METKKTYVEPVCEVTRFAVEDVVTTSIEGWNTSTFDLPSIDSAIE